MIANSWRRIRIRRRQVESLVAQSRKRERRDRRTERVPAHVDVVRRVLLDGGLDALDDVGLDRVPGVEDAHVDGAAAAGHARGDVRHGEDAKVCEPVALGGGAGDGHDDLLGVVADEDGGLRVGGPAVDVAVLLDGAAGVAGGRFRVLVGHVGVAGVVDEPRVRVTVD